MLAELYQSVINSIDNKLIKGVYFWADSTVVLHWINTQPGKLKQFVANRIQKIQEATNPKQWSHVCSLDNPADKLSRGQSPLKFINNELWRNGPKWLQQPSSNWPKSRIPGLDKLPELKVLQCFITIPYFNIFKKFSSFLKLKKAIAWWLRFIKKQRGLEYLKICELQKAEIIIIKKIQASAFANEINLLTKKRNVSSDNKLFSLNLLGTFKR